MFREYVGLGSVVAMHMFRQELEKTQGISCCHFVGNLMEKKDIPPEDLRPTAKTSMFRFDVPGYVSTQQC